MLGALLFCDCGCKVVEMGIDINLEYCPLHAAALDLLAACDEMSNRLAVFQGLCAGEELLRQLWDTEDQEALDQGIAAIQKATARQGHSNE